MVLVDSGVGIWLLWDGKCSLIDLVDYVVISGFGLGVDVFVLWIIVLGLFNVIFEVLLLMVLIILDVGNLVSFGVLVLIGVVVSFYVLKDLGKIILDIV